MKRDLSPVERTLLTRCLAAYESPWLPIRGKWRACPAIYARRRGDVPNGIGGGSVAERQRHSRATSELVAAWLINPNGWPTETGRKLARGWTWLYESEELLRGLQRLADAIDRGDYMLHGEFKAVPESVIAGEWWGRQVGWLQAMYLPLLADGVLVSSGDVHGQTFYQLADESIDFHAVAGGIVAEDAELDGVMGDVYQRQFRQNRHLMLGDPDYHSELGECPVPLTGMISGRKLGDVDGIELLFPPDAEGDADA